MTSRAAYLFWPLAGRPAILTCGHFPMVAHNATLEYCTPQSTALHLHQYAGVMWLGDRRIRLRPGDLTLTPAGMPSRYDLPRPGQHFCVHFQAEAASGAVARLPLYWRPGAHGRWLSERLEEMTALQRQGETAGAALARAAAGTLLQGLLLWLALQTRPAGGKEGGRVSRVDANLEPVRSYLDAHQREPVSLPTLAKRFGISQNYLARRFRQRHGMTIQRYLLSRRIDHARHLLVATDLSLKAVAIEAGFGNPQYFHRQFVRMVGHNPSRERLLRMQ